jgi:hypothetical protein
MNCSARPASPPPAGERRIESACQPEPQRSGDADAFARVLQRKSGDDDDCGDERGDDTESTPTPLLDGLLQTPAPRPAPVFAIPPAPVLSCAELPPAIVEAASRAALAGDAPASVASTLQPNTTESAWQVSIGEPMGVQVELRATRAAVPATTAAQMPWDLTIGSQNLGRAALARHASRLDERLRARGLAPAHLRIEESTEDEPS